MYLLLRVMKSIETSNKRKFIIYPDSQTAIQDTTNKKMIPKIPSIWKHAINILKIGVKL